MGGIWLVQLSYKETSGSPGTRFPDGFLFYEPPGRMNSLSMSQAKASHLLDTESSVSAGTSLTVCMGQQGGPVTLPSLHGAQGEN